MCCSASGSEAYWSGERLCSPECPIPSEESRGDLQLHGPVADGTLPLTDEEVAFSAPFSFTYCRAGSTFFVRTLSLEVTELCGDSSSDHGEQSVYIS